MTKLDVLNCAASGKVDLDTPCNVGWAGMSETGSTDQRRCPSCGRRVFRCVNGVDARLRIANDEIIAVPGWLVEGVRRCRTVVLHDGHRYAHRIDEAIAARRAEGKSVAFLVPSEGEGDGERR